MILEAAIKGLRRRSHDVDFYFSPAGSQLPGDAGISVIPLNSIRLTAVFACIRAISFTLASMPWVVYERVDGGKRRAEKHPYWTVFHDEPNDRNSIFGYIESMLAHLLLWGNHYSEIRRPGARDLELLPIPPQNVTIRILKPSRALMYEVQDDDGSHRFLHPIEIVHVPGLSFDGITGIPPLAAAGEAVGIGLAAQRFAARFFGSGMQPSGVFTHPGPEGMTAKSRKTWSKWLKDNFGGGRSHNAMILEEGMTWHPMSVRPDEAQFLESRKYGNLDVARAFGVPPALIYEMDQATPKRSVEQQATDFVVQTLGPWARRIEAELNRKLWTHKDRGRFFVEALFDGLLRGDFKTRHDGWNKGIMAGIYTINEVRRAENRNPIEGPEGDVHMVPKNYQNAKALLQLPDPEKTKKDNDDAARMARAALALTPMFAEARERLAAAETTARNKVKRSKPDFPGLWWDTFWKDHRDYVERLFAPRLRGIAELLEADASDDFVAVFCNGYVTAQQRRDVEVAEPADDFTALAGGDVQRAIKWLICERLTRALAEQGAA